MLTGNLGNTLHNTGISRLLTVSLYAKRFMSCNQNYYVTRKLRQSANYDESKY